MNWIARDGRVMLIRFYPVILSKNIFTDLQIKKAHKPGHPCGTPGTRLPLLPSGPDGVHGTVVAQDPGS